MIPICDLKQQYQSLKAEIDAAMQDVAANSHYILGPNVKALENEVAEYCGCEHAVGVNSGTDALHLALRALGIGPGDEVITTPFTFIATTEAICMVGATPVFVDVDPETFNIDPKCIEPAVTKKTKAILPVHLYGQPCEMDAITAIAQDNGLKVVEDCAQAIGAEYNGRKVGAFGDAGCFSFFPSKNLGCMGDGGMLTTNDPAVYDRVEMLRRHGGKVKYHHSEIGMNSRLDELQAAILRVKLPHLDRWSDLRRQHAYRYNALLPQAAGVTCPSEWTTRGRVQPTKCHGPGNGTLRAVYHQYTLLTPQRDATVAALQQAGVGCMIYYPVPLHMQEVHADLGYRRGSLPHAESCAQRCFSIPMFPELTRDEQDTVIGAIQSVVAQPARKAA